jgi:hypothetical protein
VAHFQLQELKIKPVAHLQFQELKIKPVKSTPSRTIMSMCRVIFTVAWLTSSSRN